MPTIDQGVPIADKASVTRAKYPFRLMAVGDSFLAPDEDADRVRQAAWKYGQNHGKEFCTRLTPEGRRTWRIK